MKKADPTEKKLDEIIERLKRIEAKPNPPVWIQPYYVPSFSPQPWYPNPWYTWSIGMGNTITCNGQVNSGSYTKSNQITPTVYNSL